METGLPPLAEAPLGWRLYAMLASDLRDQACFGHLARLMEAAEPEVQIAAMKGLGALGDPRAVALLVPFVDHPEAGRRIQAIKNLGRLGDPEIIPLVFRKLSDPNYEVRREASLALVKFGPRGEDLLRALAAGGGTDRFAVDMARERLEWLDFRGRA